MRFFSWNLDFLGFSASFLCAIHCLAIPVLLAFGLFGGAAWLENPLMEWGLIITAVIIGSLAIGKGYFKQHHKLNPVIWASVGFTILVVSRFLGHELEHFATAVGGFSIAFAHYENWKSSKCKITPTVKQI
jgi:hypothetical protein